MPADPLVAVMPVSLLPVDEQEPVGNRGLATTVLRLPTEVDDPLARVAPHAQTRSSRRRS